MSDKMDLKHGKTFIWRENVKTGTSEFMEVIIKRGHNRVIKNNESYKEGKLGSPINVLIWYKNKGKFNKTNTTNLKLIKEKFLQFYNHKTPLRGKDWTSIDTLTRIIFLEVLLVCLFSLGRNISSNISYNKTTTNWKRLRRKFCFEQVIPLSFTCY